MSHKEGAPLNGAGKKGAAGAMAGKTGHSEEPRSAGAGSASAGSAIQPKPARHRATRGPMAALPGFSADQLKRLAEALDRDHVHVRELGGRQLSYIEGWYALAKANEIFGYGGWDRETVHFERVYDKCRGDTAMAGYLARVRIRVRAGNTVISREGSGWGWAQDHSVGAAHEKALKTAETDATKRALSTFGPQFGLTLYDKEQNGAADRRKPTLTLFAPDGKSLGDNLSPEAYCSGLRQLTDACKTAPELDGLARSNAAPLADLRTLAPSLRNADGVHLADVLLSLIGRTKRRLGVPTKDANEIAGGSGTKPPLAGAEINKFPAPERDFGKTAQMPSSPDDKPDPDKVSASLRASHGHNGNLNGGSTNSNEPAAAGPFSLGIQLVQDEKAGALGLALVFAEQILPAIPLTQVEKGASKPSDQVTLNAVPLAPSKIAPGPRVDKSVLAIGAERRIRDKSYLRQIHALPCTICGRQPSHAHHLRFAQGRGLSQKVSDEYVVPLCALHHGDLHRSSDEPGWWKIHKIDPVPMAAKLWARYREQDK